STLLRVLAGQIDIDEGELFIQPGLRIAYLEQDPRPSPGQSVWHFIEAGLEPDERGARQYRIRDLIGTLDLDGEAVAATLSGGELRRAAIARVLAGDPDVLLLDEPTNHLDLGAIEWLERELKNNPAAMLMISHDRAFLRNLSERTLWLDRGTLRVNEQGYAHFDEWAEEVRQKEIAEQEKLQKQIEAEEHWLTYGVTARRKRNQGRLKNLEKMREQRRQQMMERQQKIRLELDEGAPASRRVFDVRGISKSFDGITVVDNFSTRIIKGERIGIVGPNGCGKTTLIRMLTGDVEPDSGSIKRADNLSIAYFDQTRAKLDPKETLWETLTDHKIGGGGDHVNVQGRHRHVVAYLKDFLFDDKQARQPVGSLSGGERNRLLLAKLFLKSSNLLILDEPTNDLDMDMLDVLEDMLGEYEGTLILVSHDRDFLDRTVSSIISFDPDGEVREYPGGYSDMLRQRKSVLGAKAEEQAAKADAGSEKPRTAQPSAPKQAKLSYKEKRALDLLPEEMAKLERDIERIEARLATPAKLEAKGETVEKYAALLDKAQQLLAEKEEQWLELEMRREALEKQA
ncbi:MAG: ATP-binding cassette domain-containing protein, partial [Alphaproteobacteria bacterium]|nr:ATP-binding cassette domain-containing protein [Alphaproteobacteria bacterium]